MGGINEDVPSLRVMCVGGSEALEIAGALLSLPPPMSLLEAFPAPPSHIPAGPNPPPSRPPSFPLPPLPGPSRIALPDARRNSFSSSASAGIARRSVSIVGRSPLPPESLTRLAISPSPLLDDDYDVTALLPPPPIPRHRHHDSISQIDMRDLPVADDDELHTTIPPFNAFRRPEPVADPIDPLNIPTYNTPSSPSRSGTLTSPTSPLSPQEIHLEIRAARSKSSLHKNALRARSRSKSIPRSPILPLHHSPELPTSPPLPTPKKSLPPVVSKRPDAERSTSPDIDSIISATPRPLRRQPSSFSDLGIAHPRSVSRKSSLASAVSARSRKSSAVSATSPSGASEFITSHDLSNVVVRETATWELEINAVESDGEEDSDSSLDLHTPLPHLMVKHGLLSPHSKLLPRPEGGENRPESILSMATMSGILKDERNTPMRKERHRDGKMLRGGLGLTTGLGWSDSEDEDAPSPFTRRLSSLTLSRQSSTASIRSNASYFSRRPTNTRHPLSKSFSGHDGRASFDETEELAVIDEWGQTRPRAKSTARSGMPPPTSWHGRSGVGSRLSRSSTASSASFSSVKIRTTKSSPSLESEIPAGQPTRSHNSSDDTIQTPSSASSSLSMKLPPTPQDDILSNSPAMTMSRKRSKMLYDKDKHLPPLPIQPILKKQPSRIGTVGGEKLGAIPFPTTPARSRAGSITLTNATSTPSTPKPTAMVKPTSVRPLHLPQRIGTTGDRPAVPIPGLHQAASSASLRSREGVKPSLNPSRSVPRLSAPAMSRLSSLSMSSGSMPSSPMSPTDSFLKPKPRTGTGMTYRKSSSALGNSGTAGAGQERIGDGRKTPSVPSGIPHPPTLNGLGIRARSKTPVIPQVPTTAIGQAF